MDFAEISVRVQPRARRTELVAERDGVLVARVSAPPVDGKANEALRRLIAKRTGVTRGRVRIIRGERSRDKVVRIDGAESAAVRRALGLG